MAYDEVKAQLTAKRRLYMEVSKSLREAESSIIAIKSSQTELQTKIERESVSTQERSRNEYIENAMRKSKSDLGIAVRNLENLKSNYKRETDSLSIDSVYEELKSLDTVSSQSTELVASIKDIMSEDIGGRFVRSYSDNIRHTADISTTELALLFNKFEQLKSRVEKLSSRKDNVLDTKMTGLLEDMARGRVEQSPKGLLIFTGVSVVAMALLSSIAFPLYTVFLLNKAVRNIRKHQVYIDALTKCKIVEDNVKRIDNMIREQAEQEFKDRSDKVNSSFSEKIKTAEEQVMLLQEQLRTDKKNAEDSFTFDVEKFKSNYDDAIHNLSVRQNMADTRVNELSAKSKELENDINELTTLLDKELDSLQLKYMNFSSKSEEVIFEPTFLLDIVDNKPVLFQYTMQSQVIVYDALDELNKFIKLICAQIRCKLSVFNYKITVIDMEYMGRDYAQFFTKGTKNFEVVSDDDELRAAVNALNETLVKRQDMILKSSPSIQEYNKEMVRLESVPEQYHFVFVINPDNRLLGDSRFLQLCRVGAPTGVYITTALANSELKKDMSPIFNSESVSYELIGGQLKKRARDYVLKHLLGFEN